MMVRYVVFICCCLFVSLPCLHASEESDVYFNAGTEQYLRGRFAESIDDLEKAQKLDPENRKISEFMTKILLEAATQNHLSRNYRQAMQYLEKANRIAPDDAKVKELYRLTNGILNAGKETSPQAERPEKTVVMPSPRASEEGKRLPKAKAPVMAEVVRAGTVPSRLQQESPSIPGIAGRMINAIWAAGTLLVFLLLLLIWKTVTCARLEKTLIVKKEKIQTLQEEKNALFAELEKVKERSRLEHESLEQLRGELREKAKKDDEHTRVELKRKQVEENLRAEVFAQYGGEGFFQQQQAKILESMGKPETVDESSSTLESVRERISLMAENLYDYSPSQAMEYLRKTVANENPLIRSNIVRALSRIAIPETIEMLFGLYGDEDYGVKREVLKSLKQLDQKVASSALKLPPETELKVKALIKDEKAKGEWII